MDGLVEKLLRLEGAKHQALVEFDASAYDENLRRQLRLISSQGTPVVEPTDVEQLLALSQLITLNNRLLQSLTSRTPWFSANKTPWHEESSSGPMKGAAE